MEVPLLSCDSREGSEGGELLERRARLFHWRALYRLLLRCRSLQWFPTDGFKHYPWGFLYGVPAWDICYFKQLKALDEFQYKTRIFWECYQSLLYRASANHFDSIWVTIHAGLLGNEKADADPLVRRGFGTIFVVPEPNCGVDSSLDRTTVLRRLTL